MNGPHTRDELMTHVAIRKIPQQLEQLVAAVTRLARAVEFAAGKEPPKEGNA